LLSLIVLSGKTFDKIVIINKVEEALYSHLANNLRKGDVVFIQDINDLPLPEELAEYLGIHDNQQILVVFDDCMNDKNQQTAIQYQIRCRKSNISSVYMGQTYFGIDRDIRRQFNYLIVLKFNDTQEIKAVMKNYSLGTTYENLSEYYLFATSEKLSFLKIDLETSDPQKKYSKGFRNFLY